MYTWQVRFEVNPVSQAFDRPRSVAMQKEFDVSYHCCGRYRPIEQTAVFVYTLSGTGGFLDARGEYRLPVGSGFLCWVADPQIEYFYPPEQEKPWTFVWMSFSGPGAKKKTYELLNRFGPIFHLPPADSLIRKLMAFRFYAGSTRSLLPAEGGEVVSILTGALEKAGAEKNPSDVGEELVGNLRQAVRDSITSNLNVTEAAKKLNVSREHLARVFKEKTGETPGRFIEREKMIYASRLLKETMLSCKEISARLGFDAPTHFSRSFKRVFEMPPRKFRKVGSVPLV